MRQLLSALLLLVALPARAQVLTDTSSVRVCLALSGGAALGFAHIGVLKVLEREGIPVVGISGNSMGAMVGGIYAAGRGIAQVESIVVTADWGALFSSGVPFGARYLPERRQAQRHIIRLRHNRFIPYLPGGLVPLQNVEFLLMDLLSVTEHNTGYHFDSLPIPYRAVAVDLVTGRKVVMKDGRLAQAIRASIAIPGVFAPERLGRMELVDGGVQQYLPVDPLLEFEPDFIIAVLTMKKNAETGISPIDVASRSMDVIGVEDLARQKELADVLIEPNVDPFTHSDFARARGLIAAGESAATAALPQIRAKLGNRRPVRVRQPVYARPRPVVRSIRFEGRRVTRASTLRPLLRTRVGQELRFDQFHDDLVRLFHTGLFDDVNYRLTFGTGDSVDVVIELQERAYGFYSLGVRYDTDDDVVLGFEVGQGNLGGSGAGVRTALTLGNPTEARLGLTGTRLFGLPFGYRIDGVLGSTEHELYEPGASGPLGYSTLYQGGVVDAGYILGRNAFFTLGFVANRITHHGAAPIDTLRPEWVSGPRFNLEVSALDDADLPTRGRTFSTNVLVSRHDMASTRNFAAASVTGDALLPLGSRVSMTPGYDIGLSLGDLSWVEYFRTGGERFVGFPRERFITAQRFVLRLGLQIRVIELFERADYPLFLQLLTNAATFEPPAELVRPRNLVSGSHWGAGLGVRTNTPIGPLQITFGSGDFLKEGTGNRPEFSFSLSVGREFRYAR